MDRLALQVITYTLIPIGASLVGGAIAAFRPPSPSVRSMVQHFAAGVVFAAAALELLPKERQEAPVPIIVGFALGIAMMLLLRWLDRRLESRCSQFKLPVGMMAATGTDLLVDGLVLGIGFVAAVKTGILLTIALALEALFVGVSVAASVGESGLSPKWMLAVPPGLALLMLIGASVGATLFAHLTPFPFTVLLGFGIVAFLYLVTEELLVEAHEVPETPWTVSMFFIGFLVFLILEMFIE